MPYIQCPVYNALDTMSAYDNNLAYGWKGVRELDDWTFGHLTATMGIMA